MPFTLATFNVKDLFDPPPNTPAAATHLEAKLACLGRWLSWTQADVVALQEVGSLAVVTALAARSHLAGAAAIVGTPDARGIRCALLSRLPVIASDVKVAERLDFPVFVQGDPSPFGKRIPLRRGVVQVKVDAGPLGAVDVVVAHLKSGRPMPLKNARGEVIPPLTSRDYAEGHLRAIVWRSAEALFVRGLVDALLARGSANIVVAGDLNDRPGSLPVRTIQGGGPARLHSCADIVPHESRYSALHSGDRQQIDHLLVSTALRERLQAARFWHEELRDHGPIDDTQPPATDSDHAPFSATFTT